MTDDELNKQLRKLRGVLTLLWVFVFIVIALLIKAGAFDSLFR